MRRQAILAAALALLLMPAIAGAEGTWVLWREAYMMPDLGHNGWAIVGARDTKAECQEMKAKEMEGVKRNWEGLDEIAGKHRVEGKRIFKKLEMIFTEDTTILKGKQYAKLKFVCLPDTLDPRRPKK